MRIRESTSHSGRFLRYARAQSAGEVRAAIPSPWEWLTLGAVVVLASVLRLYGALAFPFEQDELYTLLESRDLFQTTLQPGIEARPLYYLLQHPLLTLLPASEVSLRLLPLLFGVLGIWVTWELGRRSLGVTAGLIAAFLVAVSPWHIHASGMARYWSLIYLLAALSYLLLPAAYASDRPRPYLLSLLVLLLGTATHPSFVFPVLGVVVALSLVSEGHARRWRWPTARAWLHLWGPYVLFLALAFGLLLAGGNEGALRNWAGRGAAASLRLIPAMIQWMTVTVFVAGAVGALLLLRSPGLAERRWGAMALLGTSLTMMVLLAASLVTDVYADYATAALPLVFVSAGGLVQLGVRVVNAPSRTVAAWVAATVLFAGVVPSTLSHLIDGTRFDYRPAFQYIARVEPTRPVVTDPIILQRWYAAELDGRPLFRGGAYLDSLVRAEGDVWAVISESRYGIIGDHGGVLSRWLGEYCRTAATHERPRLDYRTYRVRVLRCTAPGTGATRVPDPDPRVRSALVASGRRFPARAP